jgi:hypothetical protein
MHQHIFQIHSAECMSDKGMSDTYAAGKELVSSFCSTCANFGFFFGDEKTGSMLREPRHTDQK